MTSSEPGRGTWRLVHLVVRGCLAVVLVAVVGALVVRGIGAGSGGEEFPQDEHESGDDTGNEGSDDDGNAPDGAPDLQIFWPESVSCEAPDSGAGDPDLTIRWEAPDAESVSMRISVDGQDYGEEEVDPSGERDESFPCPAYAVDIDFTARNEAGTTERTVTVTNDGYTE